MKLEEQPRISKSSCQPRQAHCTPAWGTCSLKTNGMPLRKNTEKEEVQSALLCSLAHGFPAFKSAGSSTAIVLSPAHAVLSGQSSCLHVKARLLPHLVSRFPMTQGIATKTLAPGPNPKCSMKPCRQCKVKSKTTTLGQFALRALALQECKDASKCYVFASKPSIGARECNR